jgi:hypothetical protein
MYDLAEVKRQTGKRIIPDCGDIYQIKRFERPLPYYSTVVSDRWNDERFLALTRQERGDFCQLTDFLLDVCGAIGKGDLQSVSIEIGIPENELVALFNRLLEVGLLEEVDGRYFQPGLRRQYLSTTKSNGNKSRKKVEDDNVE